MNTRFHYHRRNRMIRELDRVAFAFDTRDGRREVVVGIARDVDVTLDELERTIHGGVGLALESFFDGVRESGRTVTP